MLILRFCLFGCFAAPLGEGNFYDDDDHDEPVAVVEETPQAPPRRKRQGKGQDSPDTGRVCAHCSVVICLQHVHSQDFQQGFPESY